MLLNGLPYVAQCMLAQKIGHCFRIANEDNHDSENTDVSEEFKHIRMTWEELNDIKIFLLVKE